MTQTADAELETPVEARNAEWLQGELLAGRGDGLKFLRFRPVRELDDVLHAALAAGLAETADALSDASQLARGHTGGYAVPPPGYEPIVYPVTEADAAKVLEQCQDALHRVKLPGGAFGWSWDTVIAVDSAERTVTLTLKARHASDTAAPDTDPPPVD